MDPITLALIWLVKSLVVGVSTAGVITAVVYISRLTLPIILSWFRQNSKLSLHNSNLIGATIQRGIVNGRYTVIQGVFDKKAKTMVESRVIETDQLDAELLRRHHYQQIVLYEAYEY